MCWAPRWAGWSPSISPTRTGWPASARPGSSASPPPAGCRSAGPVADRLVAAARDALPSPDAAVARQVLAADLALLADLDSQMQAAETRTRGAAAASPFAPLLTVPGWGMVRAGNYGAAVGDPARWPGHRQLYRASGSVAGSVRVRRPAPRRRDQPGRQCRSCAGR